MRAYVVLRTPDGQTRALGPGDLIGRLSTAALHLDDGRISEAHAMVSLRGRELKLLGLRGVFALGGQPIDEVVLQKGMVLEPAQGLSIQVEEVVLPEALLGLEGDGLPRQLLPGTASLYTRPQILLVPRHRRDAEAHIWDTGERWRLRIGEHPPIDLHEGQSWELGGRAFRAVSIPLERAGQTPTRLEGTVRAPLRLITHFDTAHIHLEGRVVALDGIPARILSELVALGGPVSWETIAMEIWKEEDDRNSLRRRWDVSLARLRRKLKESRVRPDLVRAGGTGQVELFLYPDDCTKDNS